MKKYLIVMVLVVIACDDSKYAFDKLDRLEKKTDSLNEIEGLTYLDKLNKVSRWHDSLAYYKNEIDVEFSNTKFHDELIFQLERITLKNVMYTITIKKNNE